MIHAAKRKPPAHDLRFLEPWIREIMDDLPLGKVVAISKLVECFEMTGEVLEDVEERESELGDWQLGRFAWALRGVRRLVEPVPAVGRQGLWIPDAALATTLATCGTARARPIAGRRG